MARLEVHTTTIAVEHVTVPSQKSFESVKTELESLVPRIDDGVFALLRDGEAERARRELEQAPVLSIFGFRDHGGLLKIYGLQRKAIQYDIGNPFGNSERARCSGGGDAEIVRARGNRLGAGESSIGRFRSAGS